MKKRTHRRRQEPRAPMMVMREMFNKELETKELVAVRAFQWGAATKLHYDLLMDISNMLLVAGSSDDSRHYASDRASDVYIPTLANIKARYDKTGVLGVNAMELRILLDLIEFSKQFWNRQPIELYALAGQELKKFYESLPARQAPHTGEDEPVTHERALIENEPPAARGSL